MTPTTLVPTDDVKLSTRARRVFLTCFELDDLRILVSDHFEVRLDWVVSERRKFEAVVFDLIEWAEKNGRMLQLLTAAALRNKRMELAALRDECAAGDPSAPSDPVASCAAAFRQRVDLFQHLNAYKQLHDTLHRLDGALPALAPEAQAWADGRAVVSVTTQIKLRKFAADAVKYARRTDSRDDLGELMTELSAAVDRFLTSADGEGRRRAFADIEALPAQKLGGLNSDLVRCAKDLELPALLAIADRGRRAAGTSLAELLADFITPADRLTGLVRAHNLCQRIDLQLRQAEAGGAEKAIEVPLWSAVNRWLAEVVADKPAYDPVGEFRRDVEAFSNGDLGVSEFALKFGNFFLTADEAVRDVIGELLDATLTLLNRPEFRL